MNATVMKSEKKEADKKRNLDICGRCTLKHDLGASVKTGLVLSHDQSLKDHSWI